MIDPNAWLDYRLEDALQYPYNVPEGTTNYKFVDAYYRNTAWLLASLARFGQLCQNGNVTLDNQRHQEHLLSLPLRSLSSLCTDELLPPDMTAFKNRIQQSNNDDCFAGDAELLPKSGNQKLDPLLPDFSSLQVIIFYQCLSPDKWVIFRLSLSEEKGTRIIDIDGYFIGAVEGIEVTPLVMNLYRGIGMSIPLSSTRITWRRRLHVPTTFKTNYVHLTFLMVNYLQHSGNYLDLSVAKIMDHKFDSISMYHLQQYHDLWLGQLKLDEIDDWSHLFICNKPVTGSSIPDLEQLGWEVIDVEGDGNCGYYSILLGLENIGILDYHVERGASSREAMHQNRPWQDKVYELRRNLRTHSQHLVDEVYPKNNRDMGELLWILSGATNDAEIDGKGKTLGLSAYFAPTHLRVFDYFSSRFKYNKRFHLNPYWGAIVVASLYRIRVILYIQNASENNHTWSTLSLAYCNETHTKERPHIEIIWLTDLMDRDALENARISDVEFKRRPTIEMVFQTGFLTNGKHSIQHVQFLRCVICSGVPLPLEPSAITLREALVIPHWDRLPILAEEEIIVDQVRKTKQMREHISMGKKGGVSKQKEKQVTKSSGRATKHLTKKTKRMMAVERAKETKKFNELLKRGEITPSRIFFNSSENRYYVANYSNIEGKEGESVRKIPVDDIGNYHTDLVEISTRNPDRWVGPSLGASGNEEAPDHLCTNVRTIYQQHDRPFCLTYSFASALFYCGFKNPAQNLAMSAKLISRMDFDEQIATLREFMPNLVPWIGSPTLYGMRTARHDRKKRWMTWDVLFKEITPYPTIIIPMRHNGTITHAFCVVDDLIFDSSTPYAMKLQKESVQWIFENERVKIFHALHFNTKVSPPGCMKVKGKYQRQVIYHWDHPARARRVIPFDSEEEQDGHVREEDEDSYV